MLLHHSESLSVRGHLRAGVNGVAENNLFWDLARQTAGNTTFDPDTAWLEMFVKPGLSFDYRAART